MEDHTSKALENARRLPRVMTLPEVLLWQRLKGKPDGIKFRKQHPFGNFVLDFYCAAKRVAIEVDGVVHDMGNRPERDDIRESWLKSQEIEVVRIAATDVLKNPDDVAESIVRHCASVPPPSAAGAAATSPSGGGLSGALS